MVYYRVEVRLCARARRAGLAGLARAAGGGRGRGREGNLTSNLVPHPSRDGGVPIISCEQTLLICSRSRPRDYSPHAPRALCLLIPHPFLIILTFERTRTQICPEPSPPLTLARSLSLSTSACYIVYAHARKLNKTRERERERWG